MCMFIGGGIREVRRSLSLDDVVCGVDEKYVKICGDCRRLKKGVNTDMSGH